MEKKEIAGRIVDLNDEGYMTDPSQWNEEIAVALAREEGIDNLGEKHWEVIKYLQSFHAENQTLPTIRKLKKSGLITVKELYGLFPGGPLKKSSRIAGLLKPASCI